MTGVLDFFQSQLLLSNRYYHRNSFLKCFNNPCVTVDLALNQSQTLVSPIFWIRLGTICGIALGKVYWTNLQPALSIYWNPLKKATVRVDLGYSWRVS